MLGYIKRLFKRPPIFVVFEDFGAKWRYHELAQNGRIQSLSQQYTQKASAVRAARREAAKIEGATVRVMVAPDVP